jgi:alkylresorcinol/alkylpyrone synthase
MTVSIRSIECAVPETVLTQTDVRDLFAGQPGISRLGRRLISTVFDASAIDTRHTVLTELAPAASGPGDPVFCDPDQRRILAPATGVRNDVYVEQSPALFVSAAEQALAAAAGIEASDVTHVVTASCTGFFAPGPDYAIVRELKLEPSTQRYHLGFMGCYAAFPALRAAQAFCLADPDAVVLVVCAELCTIHLRSSNDADTIVASSVFADGAAAAVVSAQPVEPGETVLTLDAFESALTPVGEEAMA